MSEIALRLLVDSSLRVVLVATLVAAALAALRVHASTVRHTAWTVVLIAMLLMPVLSVAVPTVNVPLPEPVRRIVAAPAAPTQMALPGVAGARASRPITVAPAAPRRQTAGRTVSRPAAPNDSSRRGWSWSAAALGVYVSGVVLMLLRLALGLRDSRRLARSARRVDSSSDCRLGTNSAVLCESHHITVPVTVGLFAPTVILPSEWRRWSDSQLRAVLAHEQAHVARRDPLVAALASLNLCLCWFHPLAWWLRRTLALTAEHACDEAALHKVGAPQIYIDVLRTLAGAVRARGGRYLRQGVGMNGSPLLARRIAHIRRVARGRPASSIARPAIAAGCCLVTLAVAACRPADDVPAEYTRQDIERLILAESRLRPVESLIDGYPDTEVAVAQADRPRAEEMLLRRRTDDPTGPWSARLGRFYAASIAGYYVRITDDGPLREMTDFDPESAFAAHARTRLAESSDPRLLTAGGEYLVSALHDGGSFTERHVLAKDYLDRAATQDPESVRTRTLLAWIVSNERRWFGWLGNHDGGRQLERRVAPADYYDELAALPAAVRFEAMAQAALGSHRLARLTAHTNDRNMARDFNVHADNARRFAQEVLELAPRFVDMPDAGLFIYQAHMTLASLAMLDGDTSAAAESLRDAAQAPPAEGLAYGRWVAAWVVIRELTDAGEGAAVVDFLEAMSDKSVVDRDGLLATADDVRNGQPPTRIFERYRTVRRLPTRNMQDLFDEFWSER